MCRLQPRFVVSGIFQRAFPRDRCSSSRHLAQASVWTADIVREFQDGQSPEAIRSSFPTLTLEQVYGAITFYLGHRAGPLTCQIQGLETV